MKKILLATLCIAFAFSCKNKTEEQTPPPSKEEQENKLAEEKFAEIDLSQVDEYPLFAQCADTLSKDEKLKCFETNLIKLYSEAFAKHKLAIGAPLSDTLYMYLNVSNEGKIGFERVESSERTKELLPSLDSLLNAETSALAPITPAKKQGISVSSQYKLPLIINVK